MAAGGYPGDVRLVDRMEPDGHGARFEAVAADLTDPNALRAVLTGADRVLHLAALPGGAAERDPQASRRINLDVILNMIEALSAAGKRARLIHVSSIAVFGAPLPELVDDSTAPIPAMVYGAHKRMAEIALQDAVRRGAVGGMALRLPGIVARPRQANGLASAFLSDLFWAIPGGDALALPVGPDAMLWLMSAVRCADNLLHALQCPLPGWRDCVATLPAIRCSVADLIAAILEAGGGDATAISYAPDEAIEAQFGRYPPLGAALAERLGFRADESLSDLVRAAMPVQPICQPDKVISE
jgi:nucleoside-diphosphate-sugar epimerase